MTEDNKQTSIGNSILDFVRGIFDIHDLIDKQRAREDILASIDFKGMSAYILVASIMVASIGLNANSVAVVIGAMLISPLMGPIVGLGYSIAVNDWDTLRRSLINFAVMVVIALLTSTIYFTFAPLKSLNEQLQGRIEPTSLDVMIAFFGGFAGIAALSSKAKNANVIAGVAIATALMPPLCTAGYGLSMGSKQIGYEDFTGFRAALNALYLFFINSVFIGIATYIFLKFTRFPLVKYQNAKQAKKTNLLIVSLAILTMIPSAFIFYRIINKELYKSKVQNFLNQEVATAYEGVFFNLNQPVINDKNDSLKIVSISTISERIPEAVIENWNKELQNKYNLLNTRLVVQQGSYDMNAFHAQGQEFLQSLYKTTELEAQKKDSTIQALKSQIASLNSDTIPFQSISKELKGQYSGLDQFGYALFNYKDYDKKQKTVIPTFILSWKEKAEEAEALKERKKDEERIKSYLKSRLKLDTIRFLKE